MKKATLIAALALTAVTAQAGLVQPAVVDVDLDNRFASGDMATARFADDDVTFIGCGTRHLVDPGSPGGLFEFGFCQAQDADEESMTCFTENAALVDKLSNSSSFSFITFSWDENDECVSAGFSTQSFYIPEFLEGDGAFPGQGNGPGNNNGNGNGNGGGNP